MAIDMFRRGTRLTNGNPIASGALPGHTEESNAKTETKEVQRTNTMARGVRWITNAGVRER